MPEILTKEILKAISTETRQEIIKMLTKRPYTASEIAKITKKHVTTISEHLVILEKSGLIEKKDSSNKWIYYALTSKGEKLFKPANYNWVVVFSTAVLALFFGVYTLTGSFTSQNIGSSYETTKSSSEISSNIDNGNIDGITSTINSIPSTPASTPAEAANALIISQLVGVLLIGLSFVGFGYLIRLNRKNRAETL